MKDLFGITCSGLCIAHCLFLPIALALGVPASVIAFGDGEQIHRLLAVLIVVMAAWSLPLSWRRHRKAVPLAVGALGVVLLLSSLLGPASLEIYFVVASGFALIVAHAANLQLLVRKQHNGH